MLELLCADDADAGEYKKSHKSSRQRQRDAVSSQREKEEAAKRQWEGHRSSVSSHSSGDEVSLHSVFVVVLDTTCTPYVLWADCELLWFCSERGRSLF